MSTNVDTNTGWLDTLLPQELISIASTALSEEDYNTLSTQEKKYVATSRRFNEVMDAIESRDNPNDKY